MPSHFSVNFKYLILISGIIWWIADSSKVTIDRTRLYRTLTSIPAVSKVWIINLASRAERMDFMNRQMTNLKIPYERFEAFDFGNGSDEKTAAAYQRLDPNTKINITLVNEELNQPVELTMKQSWGSVGCWQSHLQLYMDIVYGSSANYPGPFLILEDDVKVTQSIVKYLSYEYLYRVLPSNWEMVYFDYIGLKCHNENSSRYFVEHDEFCKVNFTYATGGYLIRDRNTAMKLVEAGNTDHLSIADKFTNPLFQSEHIHAYAIYEKVIFQLPKQFGSDIRTAAALEKTIEKFYSSNKKIPEINQNSNSDIGDSTHQHKQNRRKNLRHLKTV